MHLKPYEQTFKYFWKKNLNIFLIKFGLSFIIIHIMCVYLCWKLSSLWSFGSLAVFSNVPNPSFSLVAITVSSLHFHKLLFVVLSK
jgi:hypothetical protein